MILQNGIFIMLAAAVFFGAFDTLTKYLTGSFGVGEVAFVRFGFGALMMLPYLRREKPWQDKRSSCLLILRALLGAGAFYLSFFGFRDGTLSVTMVLFSTSPLWALLLSAYVFKERLTWERILVIFVAIAGITILLNPFGKGMASVCFYGLVAGMLGGIGNVVTRYLRIGRSAGVIYGVQCWVGILFSVPWMVGHVRIPNLNEWGLLLSSAVLGLLGQICTNHGFRYIRAAEGGTLVMLEAVLTAVAGMLLFQEPLTVRFVVATVMILGSGMYLGLRTGQSVVAPLRGLPAEGGKAVAGEHP